ncbi:MAG: carboxypeptidase-like regulatory domain-containing protein, partial [Planctomycetota bacterium]
YLKLSLKARTAELLGESEIFKAPEGEKPWPEVDIALGAPSQVAGFVRSNNAKPVASAKLSAFTVTEDRVRNRVVRLGSATTREDGSYALSVPVPGEYEILTHSNQFAESATRVVVGSSGEVRAHDIVLEGGRSVRGLVTTRSGEEVAGAEVFVSRFQDSDEDAESSAYRRRRVRDSGFASRATPRDGSFHFEHLPDERLTFVARAPGYTASHPVIVDADSTDDVEIILPPLTSIEGRVVVKGSKSSVSLFQIHLAKRDDPKRGVRNYIPREFANADGSYQFRDILPGSYMIGVGADGFAPAGKELEIRDGESSFVEFELEPQRVITGRVVDKETGEPIDRASVSMRIEGKHGSLHRHLFQLYSRSTVSGSDGRFEVTGLKNGTYWLSVRRPDYRRDSRKIELVAGTDFEAIEVPLAPAGKILVQAKPRPIPKPEDKQMLLNRILILRRRGAPEGERPVYSSVHEKDYEIEGVLPGTYDITLESTIADEAALAKFRRTGSLSHSEARKEEESLGEIVVSIGEDAELILDP